MTPRDSSADVDCGDLLPRPPSGSSRPLRPRPDHLRRGPRFV